MRFIVKHTPLTMRERQDLRRTDPHRGIEVYIHRLLDDLEAAEAKLASLVKASSLPMTCRSHGDESGGWWCDGCRTAMVSRKLLADAVEIATPSQDTDTP